MGDRTFLIEGQYQILVTKSEHDWLWHLVRFYGEDSDEYKTECRRLLGLGPEDHVLDSSYLFLHHNMYDSDVLELSKSPLITYEEKWWQKLSEEEKEKYRRWHRIFQNP